LDKLDVGTRYIIMVQACYPDDLISLPIEAEVNFVISHYSASLLSISLPNKLR